MGENSVINRQVSVTQKGSEQQRVGSEPNSKEIDLPVRGLCCTHGVKCVLPLSLDGLILRVL